MQELQGGVWHWEAPHPEWKPGDEWDERVSSYAIDDGEQLVLFDPLAVPSELEARAASRRTTIVLTCPWHERETRSLVERFDAAAFVPSPEEDEPIAGRTLFTAGDALPVGVQAYAGQSNDLLLWVPRHGAVVAGDALIDRGNGLEIPADWVGDALDEIRESVRALLELPVQHVLATHGGPTDRAALERALA